MTAERQGHFPIEHSSSSEDGKISTTRERVSQALSFFHEAQSYAENNDSDNARNSLAKAIGASPAVGFLLQPDWPDRIALIQKVRAKYYNTKPQE